MIQGKIQPNCIIGGAPRSGTTYVAAVLDRHPDIFLAKPLRPEPKVFLVPLRQGETYWQRYNAVFAGVTDESILIEKTTNYLENTDACSLIAENLAEVKMVFILREPVQRAYGNYLWTKKNGLESLSFEEAIDQEGRRGNPLGPEKEYARPYDYLTRGHYDVFFRRYNDALGGERIWLGLFEELATEPEIFFSKLLAFLGARAVVFSEIDVPIPQWNLAPGPELNQETRKRLRERLRPSVERLAQLSGLDLSVWGY